ncbi:MAG: inverse autotransporter beta domain-containing protein [Planctomycetaceae bacterium]
MRTVQTSLMILLLIPLSMTGIATAQTPLSDDSGSLSISDDAYDASGRNFSGTAPLGRNGSYLLFQKQIGSGVGYEDGYSTIGGFVPFYEFSDASIIFGTARLFVTDDDELPGVNVGAGVRQYLPLADQMIGASVFFDSDETGSNNRYDQVTFSAEWIDKFWEVRSNVYLPTSEESNQTGLLLTGTTPFFQGQQILFEDTGIFETPMKGVDLEFGVPLFGAPWARGYAGTYYYNAPADDDPIGFRGRMLLNFTEDISTEVAVSEDRLFGTRITVGVQVTFSGRTIFNPVFPQRTVLDKRFDQVARNYRIAMGTSQAPVDTPAINPLTDLPYVVTHVDDSFPGPGDGTFENRFTTLQNDISDIILVWRGNTTPATPLIGGVTLINNQRLLGEGIPHTFVARDRGTFAFPGFDDALPKPFVTQGAVGPVIELADNNEVSGFNIVDTTIGRSAIFGNGIVDFDINNVDVVGNGPAFNLLNASGTGRIVDSSFALGIGVSSTGVNIANTAVAPLDVLIDNFATASGGLNGLRLSANAAQINATVDDFLADNNRTGLSLIATAGGELNVDITDSTFTDATAVLATEGRGVQIQAVAGNVNLTMDNTLVTGASSHGMEVSASAGSLFTGEITDSSFSNAMGNGIMMTFSNSPGANILTMTDTTVDNAGLDGMHLIVQNNSLLTVDITDGSFINAGGDAFDTTVTNDSTLNLFVDPTPATGATDNGFRFVVSNDSTLNATFLDSSLGNAGMSAILGTVTNGSVANVSFTNGSLANNGINAINIFGDDSDVNLTVVNANAQFNGSHGGQFIFQNDGDLVANISDSNFSNNPGDAFFASVTGTGSSALFTLDNVLADLSGDSGFDFSATNNSVFSLTATDSSFDQSGSHGITGAVDDSVATLALTGVSLEQSTLNGVDLTGTNDADITATFDATTVIENNNGNGVAISLDDSDGHLTFDNTSVDDNDLAGLAFSAVNGSTLEIDGTGASFTNNGTDGISGSAIGAGTDVNMTMTDVLVNDHVAGFGMNLAILSGAQYTGEFTNAQFNNNANTGINLVTTLNASSDLSLVNSDVSNNGLGGIETFTTVDSTLRVDLLNTTVNINGGNGLSVFADDSTVDVVLDGNTTLDDNFGDGYFYQIQNGADLITTAPNEFVGRSLSGNFGSGISGFATGAGTTAQLIMDRTRINNNFDDGMTFAVNAGATLDVELEDVRIDDQFFGNGINTTVTGPGSLATFDVLTSFIENNGSFFGDQGFLLDVSGGADAVADFRFTNIQGNGGHGIQAIVDGAGSTLAISTDADTTVTNHTLDGIEINAFNSAVVTNADFGGLASSNAEDGLEVNLTTNGSVTNLTFAEFSSFSNNLENGVDLNLNNGDITNLNMAGTTSDNELAGISIDLQNGSSITNLSYLGVSESNNFDDGMNITVDNSVITNASISGSLIGNGDHGLEIDLTGTGAITNFTVSSATFTGNLDNGLDITVLDDAQIDPVVGNSTFSGNGGNGFELTVDQTLPINAVDVTIGNSNQFTGNNDGVLLHALTDAVILATVTQNQFTGNGNAGFHVLTEDDSSFGQIGSAATFIENQFDTNGIGLFFEARDTSNHDVLLPVNLINRQIFTGNDFGIRILTTSIVGASHRTYDIDSIDISNSTADGIDVDINGQLDDITTVNLSLLDTVTTNNNTGDGISTRTQGGTNAITILNTTADTNIQDGFRYLHEGGDTDYILGASAGTNNGGRGASIDVRANGSASLVQSNVFSDNNTQGLLLATLANSYPADPILFDGDPNNPQDHINNQSIDLFTALMIAESNTIADNLNNGMVLSVGSSTRMNAIVNGNTFSGHTDIDAVDPENSTYDIRIFPVRSANPTDSVDNVSPALDTVFRDPVAHLDLIFGASDNPVNAKFGNTGEQIDVLDEGTSISTTITQSGRFTNLDPLKANHADPVTGLDIDRPVRGFFQVHGHDANPAFDLLDGTNVDGGNFFILNGTQQSMFNTFSGANFQFPPLGTIFPDPTYP